MTSVRIRSFSTPYFPAFELNTESYDLSVFSLIAGYGPEKIRIRTLFTQCIDLCNLFLIMNHKDLINYADGNTPYVSGKDIDEVVRFLEKSSFVIFN